MANYQHTMRYGRFGNMYQSRPGCPNYTPAASCADTKSTPTCPSSERRAPRKEATDCGCQREREDNRSRECRREREDNKDCKCWHKHEDSLAGMPLAMAYVPWQRWRDIYPVCEGFHAGTIFEELDKPFLGKGGRMR